MSVQEQLKRPVNRLRLRLPQPWADGLSTAIYLPALVKPSGRRALREQRLIEREVEAGREPEGGFDWMTERIVEVPWVLRRVPRGPDQRVLDTGTTGAPFVYHRLLSRLDVGQLHVADLARCDLEGAVTHQADLRDLPFEPNSFDTAICISTLEHIGLDNTRYFGERPERDAAGDLATLRELGRVTRSGGRVLVTVPGGRDEDHGWHRQYSPSRWESLVEGAGLEIEEIDYFEHSPETGWRAASGDQIADRRFGVGATAAAAVICSSLRA